MSSHDANARPAPDKLLTDIADYVIDYKITSAESYRAAYYRAIDALGCALEALNFPECTKLLGPTVPGITCAHGVRIPGTQFVLDPVTAAFNIGTMIRWLDFNDSFGGHPSDNLGGVLAIADYVSRKRKAEGKAPLVMRDVLTGLIKAYEIQGVPTLENDLTRTVFDYVTLSKVAVTAVATQMLGGSREEIINALSNAWADGEHLRIYRQGNNTGSRKSWAAGDAMARALWLSLMAIRGEMGYPAVMTAKKWGYYDALYHGEHFKFKQPYESFVIENSVFKFVPVGSQGQTAAEAAFKMHPLVKDRLHDIEAITITSHKRMMQIMDKQGPLTNPADRDHCVQYAVAVGLIHGKINATDFSDEFAADPRIDQLRATMTVVEDPAYSEGVYDPARRSNPQAVQVRFRDGSKTPKIEVEYPFGHPSRRAESLPMVETKFRAHVAHRFPQKQEAAILDLTMDQTRFEATPVNEYLDRFVI